MAKDCLTIVDYSVSRVISCMEREMRRKGFSKEEIDGMRKKAQSSDPDNLLCVCMDYVEKVNKKIGAEDSD